MGDIQKYYENTENALPHPMVKKFINMNIKPKNAVDLGCGAGRDTIYLIKIPLFLPPMDIIWILLNFDTLDIYIDLFYIFITN